MIKIALIFISFSLLTHANTAQIDNICDRGAIKHVIISMVHKTCWDINGEILGKINQLILSHQGIKEIAPISFAGLTNLEHLDLYKNELSSLESYAFKDLKNLKLLKLNGNKFNKIPFHALVNLQNLEMLKLSGNNLKNIPVFPSFNSLEDLRLNHANIETIVKNAFSALTKLKNLDLTGNKIQKVSRQFIGVSKDVNIKGVEVED